MMCLVSLDWVTVHVLNSEEDFFETLPVEFDLQSIDDKIHATEQHG